MTVLLNRLVEQPGPESTESSHRTLMIQIRSRQLHRLFPTHGPTVAAWIRACRLEHCRQDLIDPA
jgi:hypothetical protein